ncbi:DUF2252 family protein [Terricaulis sp.]|uniref:DUF2252 family protein n=1 Tax=Terricaulis sp. TaxID=2768686 RepID=UPI003783EFAE
MQSFQTSLENYEAWLRNQLPPDLIVDAHLEYKHKAIKRSGFAFLRGTCWRWAETADHLCPDFADAPSVPALGDAHIENFGLWRDAEARLVWGVNDFDEAARTPYAYDLIRLTASAILATDGSFAAEHCRAIVDGYRAGLDAPQAFILESKHIRLRDRFTATDAQRETYWGKLLAIQPRDAPSSLAHTLADAMPAGVRDVRIGRRRAGVGSLGRARFAAVGFLNGGPVAREVKALAPSCWTRVRADAAIDISLLAKGPHRAADPHFAVQTRATVRRLAPNSRKLETNREFILNRRLLRAMGFEIANTHAADEAAISALKADLSKRRRRDFLAAAEAAAAATLRDWKSFR